MTPAGRWVRRGILNTGAREGAATGFARMLRAALPRRSSQQVCVSRRAMACDFSLIFPAGRRRALEAGFAALDEVERLEGKLSAYREDSEISRINRSAFASPVTLDEELFDLIQRAASLTEATGGAFDIAAGALPEAWGFFRGPKRVPSETELRAALASSGMTNVELDPASRTIRYRRHGVRINLGSIGKGYAIDRAVARIRHRFGTHCVLMQGGQSSLKGVGAPPGEPRGWKVGIGDPYRKGRTVATVCLRNRALGTSATDNQYFVEGGRRYGHVLDVRTGWPADQLASASALAPNGAEADALSTAFFVMGVELTRDYCQRHPDVAAVLVTKPDARGRARVIVIGANSSEVKVNEQSY